MTNERPTDERDGLLTWVEQQGLAHMRDQSVAFDGIKAQARHFLGLAMSAGGAALAYVIHQLDADPRLSATGYGAAALVIFLLGVGAALVRGVLWARAFPSVTNEPLNLYQAHMPVQRIRELELENLQGRIKEAARANATVARRLNKALFALLGSPLIFVATYLIATWFSP